MTEGRCVCSLDDWLAHCCKSISAVCISPACVFSEVILSLPIHQTHPYWKLSTAHRSKCVNECRLLETPPGYISDCWGSLEPSLWAWQTDINRRGINEHPPPPQMLHSLTNAFDGIPWVTSFCVLLPGSPPIDCEHSGSSELQKTTKMTRRSDSYLPVPGEDKNPDVEFVTAKAQSNESIVRDCIFLLAVSVNNVCACVCPALWQCLRVI